MRPVLCPVLIALALAAPGCGSSTRAASKPSSAAAAPASASAASATAARLSDAERPRLGDFPAVRGRSLQALAKAVAAGPQIGLAATVLLPGENRVAFGLIGRDNHFIYGRSALYVARSPSAPAQGPFLAPADSFVPAAPFLSKTAAADTADIKAIYSTQLRLPRAGSYAVLALSRVGGRLLGAPSTLTVSASSAIPGVGQRPPRIHTDTVASAGGDLSRIDTRQPHDDMHRVDFSTVVGHKPVVLLFATPQLCQSRVCGPVTDLELQLEHTYGNRATFIHEEVYAQNDASKGLRPQLQAFRLHSEPWLFTVDRHGRIAARLEGAFGINAFRTAIEAALGR